MLFSDEPEPIKQYRYGLITRRWTELNALRKEWIDKAISFLVLTNAGGAVAVLSFMGTSDKVRAMRGPQFTLICFAVGVIVAGIFIAQQFHRLDSMFKGYHSDSEEYLSNKIVWDKLKTQDDRRSKASWIDYALAYVSFVLFIGGCFLGALSLFKPS